MVKCREDMTRSDQNAEKETDTNHKMLLKQNLSVSLGWLLFQKNIGPALWQVRIRIRVGKSCAALISWDVGSRDGLRELSGTIRYKVPVYERAFVASFALLYSRKAQSAVAAEQGFQVIRVRGLRR